MPFICRNCSKEFYPDNLCSCTIVPKPESIDQKECCHKPVCRLVDSLCLEGCEYYLPYSSFLLEAENPPKGTLERTAMNREFIERLNYPEEVKNPILELLKYFKR